jgi:hypothetical protein
MTYCVQQWHMSYKQRPADGEDGTPATVVSVLHRISQRLRTHVAEWPTRFVEMQEDALGGLEKR